jgi:hypothetical protein
MHTKFWSGKLKRSFGISRYRWKDNIKSALKEIWWLGFGWIYLV